MAHKATTPVEVMHVGPLQTSHEGRQATWVLELHRQVKMIAHEAIMKNGDLKTTLVTPEQVQKVLPLVLGKEDGLAVMAAIDEMVASHVGPLPPTRPAGRGAGPPNVLYPTLAAILFNHTDQASLV